MSEERLPWFPCYPTKLLGALSAMTAEEGYTYVIAILRMYEVGGPIAETARSLALRAHLSERKVAAAVASLITAGKLATTENGRLFNPVAAEEIATQKTRTKSQSDGGVEGASRRWGKAKSNQQNTDRQPIAKLSPTDQVANAPPMASDAHLHLHKQEQEQKETLALSPPSREGTPATDLLGAANPINIPSKARAERKPRSVATAWPEGFALDDALRAFGQERGFADPELDRMFLRFRDHHTAKGNRFVDWRAAFRTWVGNEVEFRSRRPPPGSAPKRSFHI
jgi:hypothetical protein